MVRKLQNFYFQSQIVPDGCCPMCRQSLSGYADSIQMVQDYNSIHRGDLFASLTEIEFDLVYVLWKAYPKPVSVDNLAFQVWGGDFAIEGSRNIYVHLVRIRRKLKPLNVTILNIARQSGSYVLQILPVASQELRKRA